MMQIFAPSIKTAPQRLTFALSALCKVVTTAVVYLLPYYTAFAPTLTLPIS